MTDFFLPPDIGIASATPNLDANTSSFSSPTVGSTRTAERLGDRLRFQLNFTMVNDNAGTARQRGRLIATLMSLRGQAGRVWMTPPGATLRGSFPATELLVNNDFSNGTTGWTAGTDYSIAALDRGIRSTRTAVTAQGQALQQSVTLAGGIPYMMRWFLSAGKGNLQMFIGDGSTGLVSGNFSQGMMEFPLFLPSTSSHALLTDDSGTGGGNIAGNFVDSKWTSVSRCAMVDNGVNLLLNSDTPGTGTGWSLTGATAATASPSTSPDGTTDAWALIETVATSSHLTSQTVTVAAAVADFTLSSFVKANLRTWCYLELSNGTTGAFQWFNLSTGALGTSSIGANFTLIGTQCVDYGNGWKRCILTVRKTNAVTSLIPIISPATADNIQSYTGSTAAQAIITWRASFAQSGVPVAPVQTTSAAVSGTLQTGLQLNLKGLPVSTQGLLLPGDYIECGGQLNQMAANLDSDAAGLATAILTRPPRNSPADSTGFVVNTPMGKFMVSGNSTGWNEAPGRISDASLELVEDISF